MNPRGVQADILNTATAGENVSPDWVWESAGRRTPEGYDVEIRVPWKSIRFASGHDVKMGDPLLAARQPPRHVGVVAGAAAGQALLREPRADAAARPAPAARPRGRAERDLRAQRGAEPRRRRSATPRTSPRSGSSVKYGVTSTATVEATVNPDFSQVESDAFQVEVNQRYPVFYSEKRPFFMEGMGTFELAGVGGDAEHAHRRPHAADRRPVLGRQGARAAPGGSRSRRSPPRTSAPGRAPDADPLLARRGPLFLIGRATYSLGDGSYLGAIATDTRARLRPQPRGRRRLRRCAAARTR